MKRLPSRRARPEAVPYPPDPRTGDLGRVRRVPGDFPLDGQRRHEAVLGDPDLLETTDHHSQSERKQFPLSRLWNQRKGAKDPEAWLDRDDPDEGGPEEKIESHHLPFQDPGEYTYEHFQRFRAQRSRAISHQLLVEGRLPMTLTETNLEAIPDGDQVALLR